MFERYQNTSTEGLNQQKICGRAALGGLGTVKQFAVLARDFFPRLSRRQLSYFLSRELSQHVGVNSRFHTIRDGVRDWLRFNVGAYIHELNCAHGIALAQLARKFTVADSHGGWLFEPVLDGRDATLIAIHGDAIERAASLYHQEVLSTDEP
jgi:hypothetical protein